MAYIDCENCYHGKVCQYRRIYHDSIVLCEDWQPTADVAPKSEIAREIFEEIDSMCIDLFGNFNHGRYIELKKKYTGEYERR